MMQHILSIEAVNYSSVNLAADCMHDEGNTATKQRLKAGNLSATDRSGT
jgi:hypothetical protein